MAKPNVIKTRAQQAQFDNVETFVETLLAQHDHRTPAVASELGISDPGLCMWLHAHGYTLICRWVKVDDREEQAS